MLAAYTKCTQCEMNLIFIPKAMALFILEHKLLGISFYISLHQENLHYNEQGKTVCLKVAYRNKRFITCIIMYYRNGGGPRWGVSLLLCTCHTAGMLIVVAA
jgi:hypothetical protein